MTARCLVLLIALVSQSSFGKVRTPPSLLVDGLVHITNRVYWEGIDPWKPQALRAGHRNAHKTVWFAWRWAVPLAPIVDVLGTPVTGLPISNHDDNQHTHNENLRLQNLWDSIETLAALMTMK